MRVVFHFFFVIGGGQGLDCGVFLFLENGVFRYFGVRILLNVEDVEKLGRAKFSEKKWNVLMSLDGVTIKSVFPKSKMRISCLAILFILKFNDFCWTIS